MRRVHARVSADGRVQSMPDMFGRDIVPTSVLVGVALIGTAEFSELVAVDVDGSLWSVGYGEARELVRRCIEGFARVYRSLGELVQALRAGHAVGLLVELAPFVGVPWRSL